MARSPISTWSRTRLASANSISPFSTADAQRLDNTVCDAAL
jgi:hypothetical protein